MSPLFHFTSPALKWISSSDVQGLACTRAIAMFAELVSTGVSRRRTKFHWSEGYVRSADSVFPRNPHPLLRDKFTVVSEVQRASDRVAIADDFAATRPVTTLTPCRRSCWRSTIHSICLNRRSSPGGVEYLVAAEPDHAVIGNELSGARRRSGISGELGIMITCTVPVLTRVRLNCRGGSHPRGFFSVQVVQQRPHSPPGQPVS